MPEQYSIIMLQARCNMTCTFCVTENKMETMSPGQALSLLKKLKEESCTQLIIGGGEPFNWSGDVLKLAKTAKELGFFVQIGTNGVALPEGFEKVPFVDRYIIPLESIYPEEHNIMRKFEARHQELILDRLATLKKVKKSLTLSTVITQANQGRLLDLAEYLREYQNTGGNLHAWHLYKFIPEGRGGGKNAVDLQVPDERYTSICSAIIGTNLPFKIFRRKNMYQSRQVNFYWYEKGKLVKRKAMNA
jgi:MoaA/NifB/PqqE/SkfB family radical SAM enzyme